MPDQIALYAVYMPKIRTDVEDFVGMWNMHNIRKQKHRTNSVSGKPYMLYNHPAEGIENYGQPVDKDSLRTLLDAVVDFGTFSVCTCTAMLNNFQMWMSTFLHLLLNGAVNSFVHGALTLKNHLQSLKRLDYYLIVQSIDGFVRRFQSI